LRRSEYGAARTRLAETKITDQPEHQPRPTDALHGNHRAAVPASGVATACRHTPAILAAPVESGSVAPSQTAFTSVTPGGPSPEAVSTEHSGVATACRHTPASPAASSESDPVAPCQTTFAPVPVENLSPEPIPTEPSGVGTACPPNNETIFDEPKSNSVIPSQTNYSRSSLSNPRPNSAPRSAPIPGRSDLRPPAVSRKLPGTAIANAIHPMPPLLPIIPPMSRSALPNLLPLASTPTLFTGIKSP